MISQMELVSCIIKHLDRQGAKELNSRQLNAVVDGANRIVDELEKPNIAATPEMGVRAWLDSDDTGLSSKYFASVLSPRFAPTVPLNIPHDPGDFGRCIRLLDAAPELRAELSRLSDPKHGAAWNAIAAEWHTLEAWYREDAPTKKSDRLFKRLSEIGAF